MRVIRVVGEEHWRAVAGRPVVWLAPHFVGLDVGGSRLAADRDRQFVSMYRTSRDPLLEYLFSRRGRFGALIVERMASLKPIIRAIRDLIKLMAAKQGAYVDIVIAE